MLIIEVSNRQELDFDEERLVCAVRSILDDHEIAAGEISIAIVDDPEIRQLNRQYLDHDYETDVLSFVMDFDEAENSLDGQLIVSADTAVREAEGLGIPAADELLFYVVHGALHLAGYDDKDPAAATEMRTAEAHYMNALEVEHVWPGVDDQEDDPDEDHGGGNVEASV